MKFLKHALPIAFTLMLALVLAACGTPEPPAPTGGNGGNGGTDTATATPTTASQTDATDVLASSVSVKGANKTVLTDTQGRTLYYFTPDSPTESKCTGDCAGTWPPYLFKGSGSPKGVSDLTGTLNAQQTANGNQIIYNNHLLYTFSGDSAAGQANGEGIGGKWFVATPDLK